METCIKIKKQRKDKGAPEYTAGAAQLHAPARSADAISGSGKAGVSLTENSMKKIFLLCIAVLFSINAYAQDNADSVALRQSLDKATAAIRDAYSRGDATMVGRLHSPNVIKYFGGDNVLRGRDAVEKQAREWFKTSKVEFVENTVESTCFVGNVAIQTVIFSIKSTPKHGGAPSIARGRSMVIYVQDKSSPTGWLSLREIAQEAPPLKQPDSIR
jgi:ketosteroid isomerase-like protein